MENQSLNYELPNVSQDTILPKDHGDTSDKNKFEEPTENDEILNLNSSNENDNIKHMEGSELNENDDTKHMEGSELNEKPEEADLENARLIKENRKLSALLLTERKKRSILERKFISSIAKETLNFNAEDNKESAVNKNTEAEKESVDLNTEAKKESVDLNTEAKKESVGLNTGDKKENANSNVEDNKKEMADLHAGDNAQAQFGGAPCDENKLVSTYKKENEDKHDAFIYVTTFQLKQMESDMVSLKKLIAKREKTWGFNMEREKQFNNTIRALRIEIQIMKSLFDEKQEEYDALTKEFNDKKNELEKELRDKKTLKKIIIKLEKRHRELLSYLHISDFDIPSGNITEREQKIIRQIVTKYLANRFENKNKNDNRELHKSHSQTEFTTNKQLNIYSYDNPSRITYEENNQYSQYKFSNSCPSTPKPMSASELSKESSALSNDNDDASNSMLQEDTDIIKHIDYIKNEVLKESDGWENKHFTFSNPDPGNANLASSSSLIMKQNDKTTESDNNIMSGLDINNYADRNDTSEDDILKDEDNEKTLYTHLMNASDIEPEL